MLRVKETIHLGLPDGQVTLVKGDLYKEDHPLVKGREHLFEKIGGEDAPAKPSRARRAPAAKGKTS